MEAGFLFDVIGNSAGIPYYIKRHFVPMMRSAFLKIIIHSLRTVAAINHGFYNQGLACAAITAGKELVDIGRVMIRFNIAASIGF